MLFLEVRDYITLLFIKIYFLKFVLFFLGRTNAFKLYHDCKEGEKIQYLDFCSLYPDRQKYGVYPIKLPVQVLENFKSIQDYFGIIKCKVLPPRNLWLPVLPLHINKKLVFPLCRLCAEHQQKECNHSIDERSFIGTWVSEELLKAEKMGYKVLQIFEVYHWEERTQHFVDQPEKNVPENELFVSYINQAVKEKTEASGFPDGCFTDEQKDNYISDFFKKEGIFNYFFIQLHSTHI